MNLHLVRCETVMTGQRIRLPAKRHEVFEVALVAVRGDRCVVTAWSTRRSACVLHFDMGTEVELL